MNWEYFRDPKTGKFRPKRLPAIKSPIPVKDVTEVSDYRRDYEHLPFEEAVKEYQARFDAYDVEVGELDEVFDGAPAKYLGELSAFRRDSGLFWRLLDVESFDDLNQAEQTSAAIAEALSEKAGALIRIVEVRNDEAIRALLRRRTVAELKEICNGVGLPAGGKKADLVERVAAHEIANPGSVPMPAMIMPLPALKDRFRQVIEGMISDLSEKLKDYPDRYRRCVLKELALTLDSEHFDTRKIIGRRTGVEIEKPPPRKTRAEWDAERKARLAAQGQPQKPAESPGKRGQPTPVQIAGIVALILFLWLIFR